MSIYQWKIIESCIKIIFNTTSSRLTVTQLVSVSGFSLGYLHNIFKKNTGFTIGRFIKDVHLNYAALEVFYTNEKILVISLNSGYLTQQSFSRAFRHKFGVSPGQLRQMEYIYASKIVDYSSSFLCACSDGQTNTYKI
ncbi:AraC family transcriptional regulator [uncultured Enterobacter sp.]|uniref:helix-turn-helix transcriptional regulator n=1 Tax=uncultured Enterobacter sp. TaxID=238202 RepID=UPI00342CE30C